MPYGVTKVKGGYKVKNLNTNKKYSKNPMTKSKAETQKRLLDETYVKVLTPIQQSKLKAHAKFHSKKHMSEMERQMEQNGKSFTAAHKIATRKVGK